MRRPDRDPEDVGDPVERKVEVVVQDHHRAMIEGQAAEAAFELVTVDDRAQVVIRDRLVRRDDPQVCLLYTSDAADE